MTTIFPISLTCPACHTTFDSNTWGSTNTFGAKTTDFYQFAGGAQSLPFEIHSCPACGFTSYVSGFATYDLEDEVVELINQRLRPLVKDEQPFGGRRYEYAAWISSWRNQSPIETGWLYLKAAWCCYADKMTEEELYYRRQAIKHFEWAMDQGDVPPDQHLVYCYLIGELHRRVNDPTVAALWFDRVASRASNSDEDRGWVSLATQQKLNPKDFFE